MDTIEVINEPYTFDDEALGVPPACSTVLLASFANEEARRWTGRALLWLWGFHHEEAMRCAAAAARVEPNHPLPPYLIAIASGYRCLLFLLKYFMIDLRTHTSKALTTTILLWNASQTIVQLRVQRVLLL